MPQALILAIKVSCYTEVWRARGRTAHCTYPADIRGSVLELVPETAFRRAFQLSNFGSPKRLVTT
jgi:hypothetical protein